MVGDFTLILLSTEAGATDAETFADAETFTPGLATVGCLTELYLQVEVTARPPSTCLLELGCFVDDVVEPLLLFILPAASRAMSSVI